MCIVGSIKDKSKRPKNPNKKIGDDEINLIIKMAQNEQGRIRTL